jgi:hypothetical protein
MHRQGGRETKTTLWHGEAQTGRIAQRDAVARYDDIAVAALAWELHRKGREIGNKVNWTHKVPSPSPPQTTLLGNNKAIVDAIAEVGITAPLELRPREHALDEAVLFDLHGLQNFSLGVFLEEKRDSAVQAGRSLEPGRHVLREAHRRLQKKENGTGPNKENGTEQGKRDRSDRSDIEGKRDRSDIGSLESFARRTAAKSSGVSPSQFVNIDLSLFLGSLSRFGWAPE